MVYWAACLIDFICFWSSGYLVAKGYYVVGWSLVGIQIAAMSWHLYLISNRVNYDPRSSQMGKVFRNRKAR